MKKKPESLFNPDVEGVSKVSTIMSAYGVAANLPENWIRTARDYAGTSVVMYGAWSPPRRDTELAPMITLYAAPTPDMYAPGADNVKTWEVTGTTIYTPPSTSSAEFMFLQRLMDLGDIDAITACRLFGRYSFAGSLIVIALANKSGRGVKDYLDNTKNLDKKIAKILKLA